MFHKHETNLYHVSYYPSNRLNKTKWS